MLSRQLNHLLTSLLLVFVGLSRWQPSLQGDIAHVVVMPNIGIDILETFMADLIASRSKVSVEATRQLAADARSLHAD